LYQVCPNGVQSQTSRIHNKECQRLEEGSNTYLGTWQEERHGVVE